MPNLIYEGYAEVPPARPLQRCAKVQSEDGGGREALDLEKPIEIDEYDE